MIDYEKLKLAHELAYNSPSLYFQISLGMDDGCITLFDANKNSDQEIYNTECLNDLIAKLQELTQPKPKYEIGNEIWIVSLDDFSPVKLKISNLFFHEMSGTHTYEFENSFNVMQENKLYPTKSELIEAQIHYWMRQLPVTANYQPPFEGEIQGFSDKHVTEKSCDDVVTECQHESDCYYHCNQGFKCIKCGEFYR